MKTDLESEIAREEVRNIIDVLCDAMTRYHRDNPVLFRPATAVAALMAMAASMAVTAKFPDASRRGSQDLAELVARNMNVALMETIGALPRGGPR